ncbi:hypothetical protein EDD85DRAFT_865824 [Armillaria nabsnona]|nr:hypothetical protein EDD85DRAFT_865824 [Armillaria nabsnona]
MILKLRYRYYNWDTLNFRISGVTWRPTTFDHSIGFGSGPPIRGCNPRARRRVEASLGSISCLHLGWCRVTILARIRCFCPSVLVGLVVDFVDDVERIYGCGVDVGGESQDEEVVTDGGDLKAMTLLPAVYLSATQPTGDDARSSESKSVFLTFSDSVFGY